jgi:hypothetical protein
LEPDSTSDRSTAQAMRAKVKKTVSDFFDAHGDWWDSLFRVAFIYGVPIGIAVGAVVAAWIQVQDGKDSAAKGVLIGAGAAVVAGLGIGWLRAGHYRSDRGEVGYTDRNRLIRVLNMSAARNRYLLQRIEGDYIVYVPTLTPPIAVGPLTLTSESFTVSVQLSEGRATIDGPAWIVRKLCEAAKNADGQDLEAVGLPGQHASA